MSLESFRVEVACLSDAGRVRTLNEDGVAVDSEHGFAVVTDGMGGHRTGDIASRLALESVVERLHSRVQQPFSFSSQWMKATVAAANTAVHAAALKQPKNAGMGTTLAMVTFHEQQALLAHVGDSRIYRLRDGELELLTRDDSILNDQVEMGLIAADEAGSSRNRHFVTQALGMREEVVPNVREETLRDGDVFLLCTDGLNDLVNESDIELIVDELKTNLQLAATHLVQLANDGGGFDNITVALVRVLHDDAPPPRRGWLARLFGFN